MVFLWSLIDSKSLQISRTLLSNLTDLNNDVVWMVSTSSLISKPSSPCINPLVSVPSAQITPGITATFIFHSLLSLLLLLLLFHLFQVVHTSISWWHFTRIWVSASFLMSPGLSEYSSHSQHHCRVDSFDSFSDFRLLQSSF